MYPRTASLPLTVSRSLGSLSLSPRRQQAQTACCPLSEHTGALPCPHVLLLLLQRWAVLLWMRADAVCCVHGWALMRMLCGVHIRRARTMHE